MHEPSPIEPKPDEYLFKIALTLPGQPYQIGERYPLQVMILPSGDPDRREDLADRFGKKPEVQVEINSGDNITIPPDKEKFSMELNFVTGTFTLKEIPVKFEKAQVNKLEISFNLEGNELTKTLKPTVKQQKVKK